MWNHKVIEVVGSIDIEGSNVGVGLNTASESENKTAAANQKWTVVYVDKAEATMTEGLDKNFGFYINRPFYIVSRMPLRRVIEVVEGQYLVLNSRVGTTSQS